MRLDVGVQDAELLEGTVELANVAQQEFAHQITALAGRRFFGESRVTLVWVAGQITEVRPNVEQRIR